MIVNDIVDFVFEFGGVLFGEHGDGLVCGLFIEWMFGIELYDVFWMIKCIFDLMGLFNLGKIVDLLLLILNFCYGTMYCMLVLVIYFDYLLFGGFGWVVEMCSGVGVCCKMFDGIMCLFYMVICDEVYLIWGCANVLCTVM